MGLVSRAAPVQTAMRRLMCEMRQSRQTQRQFQNLPLRRPISTSSAERVEPLKCLGGQLQGKLTCGKLSTECRSLSGV
jgi:hypothetical protein